MRAYIKLWTAGVAVCLVTLVLAALLLPQSFGLTALSDVMQSLLLFSATVSFFPHSARSHGRLRLFWTLLALGIALWFSYQLLWTYFEVWLRQEVPDLFMGDIVLFLHIVPMMAALALRPHAPADEYAGRLRRLDFALMMAWWIYLYIFAVIPWQYVVPNGETYGHNLNSLYLVEKLAFLTALALACCRSKEGWRSFYAHLLGASALYAASSYIANWALSRHSYYSGSLYDVPLGVSMAWITLIGLWTRASEPQAGVRSISASHSVWLARLGMMTAFSLPLFAAWALLDTAPPAPIRSFRILATLTAALIMGVMVFVRQRLLDRELLRLLNYSRESIANLKRLQAQITESQKLASIGQLVGGVAHELNNPITALLGYSDLLLCSALTPAQKEMAGQIGQHARRTRALVASLLSFAMQRPAAMASVDLIALLRTAVKLSQPQWQSFRIEVRTEFPAGLLPVHGDSNQLLQVFVQIIDDALHAVHEKGGRALNVFAEAKDRVAILRICDETPHPAVEQAELSTTNWQEPAATGLGMSACQGIVRQHQGRILCLQGSAAATAIRVEIPLTPPAPEKLPEPGVPVMWRPQPSA